jgi:hypothetical protein
MPDVEALTAHFRMAPAAMRTRLVLIPMELILSIEG